MKQAIKSVLALPHLQPCPEVNCAFSTLVSQVVASGDELPWDAPVVCAVQRRCAAAESALELHWSAQVAVAADPRATLDSFPYADNYQELARRELALLAKSGLQLCRVSRAAVIGSGPLPLTAWWMHQLTRTSICRRRRSITRHGWRRRSIGSVTLCWQTGATADCPRILSTSSMWRDWPARR
ncbi:MAG: hypothetical protein CSB46_10790 [Micrococcales bacterium]|nr:MAG: hypothetical protein CSB46_10790 [Micrococcales bacterium]